MKKIAIAVLALALAACGGNTSKQNARLPHGGFHFPQVPSMLTAPAERSGYVAIHYWDGFDFSDTAFLHTPEFRQKLFPDYAGFLSAAPQGQAEKAIAGLFGAIEKQDTAVWNLVTEGLNYYFYDPNSPMRNDELYIPMLKAMIASGNTPPEDKLRYQDRLTMAGRNRVGEKATDFVYTTASGRQGRLFDLRSEWVILFFNNPGCHACAQIMADFSASPDIARLLADGSLKVLSVYPDEDLKAWKEYYSHYPRQWTNAFDKAQVIRSQQLYDLKAIPSIYLLDRDKKVVVKDASEVAPVIQALGR